MRCSFMIGDYCKCKQDYQLASWSCLSWHRAFCSCNKLMMGCERSHRLRNRLKQWMWVCCLMQLFFIMWNCYTSICKLYDNLCPQRCVIYQYAYLYVLASALYSRGIIRQIVSPGYTLVWKRAGAASCIDKIRHAATSTVDINILLFHVTR